MNNISKDLLLAVSDLHQMPSGAFNIRENGKSIDRKNSANIEIVPKEAGDGIDIYIKPNTINESVHIPVIISASGIKESVMNDFHIGENSDVLIVAGCGIHNAGEKSSEHSGIHKFYLAKNSTVKYVERHIGVGTKGDKVFNPVTEVYLGDGAKMIMESTQLGGVTSTCRKTYAKLLENSNLIIKEKLLTNDSDFASSIFEVDLDGENASCDVISRSVAKGKSRQEFYSSLKGAKKCFGHVECDAIIMDNAVISATPKIVAECVDASLVHEAAIGKIAGEQLIKLMTLGLDEKQAEEMIVNGFLNV